MKTALITGVSGGIGKAIATSCIKNGYFTVCHYNSGESEIQAFRQELESQGLLDYACFYKADFTDNAQVEGLYDYAVSAFGHIDLLVNNAGIDLYKQLNYTTEKDFIKVFDINVKSAFTLSRLCVEKMIERKQGNIIFISSVWGKVGGSMESVYSASKSALIGFTKALAKELAPSGIRVNAINAGVIDTKMNAGYTEQELEKIVQDIPLGRLGLPIEIAQLALFLASDKASYITGQDVTIDGGYIL